MKSQSRWGGVGCLLVRLPSGILAEGLDAQSFDARLLDDSRRGDTARATACPAKGARARSPIRTNRTDLHIEAAWLLMEVRDDLLVTAGNVAREA